MAIDALQDAMPESGRLSRSQLAWRTAQAIPDGSYVNLGIGIPTQCADHLPDDREIVLHSENGILGFGPRPPAGEEDPDLVNAGKQPITMLAGGAYFVHSDAFAMIRGGHIDIAILGAFQVSGTGDLANWTTDSPSFPPGVGGAMDLAAGARQVWVLTDHVTRKGEPKIVNRCTYPLTAAGCVRKIFHRSGTDRCHAGRSGSPGDGAGHDPCGTAGDDGTAVAPCRGLARARCPTSPFMTCGSRQTFGDAPASSVTSSVRSLARPVSTRPYFCVVRCGWLTSIAAITSWTVRSWNAGTVDAQA